MIEHNRAVLERCYDSYARGDFESVADCLAVDVIFALHVDREVAPFGGVSIGKPAFVQRCESIQSVFEIMVYDVVSCAAKGETVHGHVAYHYRHRASGEDIAETMRHEAWFRDGLIARLNEFHDRARVEAFMRLVGQVVQNQ